MIKSFNTIDIYKLFPHNLYYLLRFGDHMNPNKACSPKFIEEGIVILDKGIIIPILSRKEVLWVRF